MLFSPRALLFDLDGTLIDSAPDLATSAAAMMRQLGLAEPEQDQVISWIGDGLDVLLQRVLHNAVAGELSPRLLADARVIFHRLYRRHLCRASRLYPGMESLLQRLAQAGLEIACVTNKSLAFTRPLLQALLPDGRFSVVIGGDTLARRKPHPEPLLYAAKRLALAPAECLMVGDSGADLAAARSAGMPVVWARYGYGKAGLADDFPAVAAITTPLALWDLLKVDDVHGGCDMAPDFGRT